MASIEIEKDNENGPITLEGKDALAYPLYQEYRALQLKIEDVEKNWLCNWEAFPINAFRLLSFVALLVYTNHNINPHNQEIGWIILFAGLFVVSMCSCCVCTVWSFELSSRLEDGFTENEKTRIGNLMKKINQLRSDRDTAVYYREQVAKKLNREQRTNFKLTRY